MSTQKRLRSLEDLKELLPASAVQQSGSGVTKQGSRHDGKGRTVHLRLETGGRKGKAVTVITGLTLDVRSMERLARDLKQHCGAGGTVKEGCVEIQGDQRERIGTYLRSLSYIVR